MRVVTTRTVAAAMERDPAMRETVFKSLDRFFAGDWGEVPDEDKAANNRDVQAQEGRVLARYGTPSGDIYIICYPGTDEPATVLLTSEY